ncbi:MAG: 50S ribosomal protein L25 [Candidatus Omnitrophica bacterium]|jgi:large subunit ribosomal protein L25|nr:50S ribosomal protein L25 [Candidatus Omnitrophota bacterium]
MQQIDLDVQVRDQIGTGKVRSIRRENFVPGIVYGSKKEPTPVKVSRKAYERIRREHHGEAVIFRLNVLQGDKKLRDYAAIVKEEQHHPVSDQVIHIDFNRISLTDKITVKVAVHAVGEPVGVKRDGGSLEHVIWELDVSCLPTQIPHHLEVEVSKLEIGDSIHVRDLVLPEGVTTKNDPDSILVKVVPPMKEEAPSAEAAPAELEVIKEKKDKEPAGDKKEAAPAAGDKKADDKKKA